MAEVTDSMGRSHEALIAEQDATVADPLTGLSRKLFAGQPVPGGLEGAYLAAVAKPKPRTPKKEKSDA